MDEWPMTLAKAAGLALCLTPGACGDGGEEGTPLGSESGAGGELGGGADGGSAASLAAAGAGGTGPSVTPAECQARCDAAVGCPESPWDTRDRCIEECTSLHEPAVPAECASLLVASNACVVGAYAQCQLGYTEVCPAETEALGACVRGPYDCENDTWWNAGSLFDGGIYHQWACRWAGPSVGAQPGEPCIAHEDCAVVVCECVDTPASYGLQVCSPEGTCATDSACASISFRDWLCRGGG